MFLSMTSRARTGLVAGRGGGRSTLTTAVLATRARVMLAAGYAGVALTSLRASLERVVSTPAHSATMSDAAEHVARAVDRATVLVGAGVVCRANGDSARAVLFLSEACDLLTTDDAVKIDYGPKAQLMEHGVKAAPQKKKGDMQPAFRAVVRVTG